MADFQKQTVQWFPGHMAKTRRIIKESLSLVDGVVELVDARIPYSSSNPELDSIIKRKPRIVLLNKCDIADSNVTKLWIDYYKNNGKYAIPVDCRTGRGLNAFIPTVNRALADVIEKNRARGMENKPLRLMVVGIPNTGKSSFINRMAGNSKAKVADKAGVTRQKQWFAVCKGIELLDTPGVLWPKFDDPEVGDKLAFTGAVKDEVTDLETLSCRLLETLGKTYVVETNNPFYYKDGSVLCIGNPFRLNPYYLKLFFESSAFANQYLSESDGTTVATLTMVRLNRYLIPVPPLKEQTRIVEKIKTVTSIMRG